MKRLCGICTRLIDADCCDFCGADMMNQYNLVLSSPNSGQKFKIKELPIKITRKFVKDFFYSVFYNNIPAYKFFPNDNGETLVIEAGTGYRIYSPVIPSANINHWKIEYFQSSSLTVCKPLDNSGIDLPFCDLQKLQFFSFRQNQIVWSIDLNFERLL